jgi:hypothetical protein
VAGFEIFRIKLLFSDVRNVNRCLNVIGLKYQSGS